jgi:hypothetical protein
MFDWLLRFWHRIERLFQRSISRTEPMSPYHPSKMHGRTRR